MKDLLLGETGDVVIKDFDLAFTKTESEYVSQKLGFKLTLVKGEWFLDLSKGISYFKDIYKKNPDLKIVGDLFKKEIISISEIRKIPTFQLSLTVKRELLLNFSVSLQNGETLKYEEFI
ncbi:MAG: hypothetical protein B6241_12400 [Spirochaetaceae bacterium 4572_59]|nr:MAG: hypothetical protein B6241_12400 [Spirochaetaceae bacterium 4572_59]